MGIDKKTESPFSSSSPLSHESPAQNTFSTFTGSAPTIESSRAATVRDTPPDVVYTLADLNFQRRIGALMLVIGSVSGYFAIYRVVQAALQGAATIHMAGIKLTALSPVLLVIGATLLAAPRFALEHLGGFQSSTPKSAAGWLFLVVIIASGFVVWWGMRSWLTGLGYRV